MGCYDMVIGNFVCPYCNNVERVVLEQTKSRACQFDDYAKEVKKETPEEYIQKQIDNCLWNIEYHQKEWDKEVKRTNERNLWIKQLRDSFKS